MEYSAVKVISIPQSEHEMSEIVSEKMTNEQSKAYYKDIADDLVKEIEILKALKGVKNIVVAHRGGFIGAETALKRVSYLLLAFRRLAEKVEYCLFASFRP